MISCGALRDYKNGFGYKRKGGLYELSTRERGDYMNCLFLSLDPFGIFFCQFCYFYSSGMLVMI